MTQEISTKTFVLVLYDQSKFFLTREEGARAKENILKGAKFLEIGESLVSVASINKMVNGGEYEEAQRIKRGEIQCSCGNWLQKGQKCGYCA